MTTLGERFARALAAKDYGRVTGLLHPAVDFRGMTPSRFWEASTPDQVVEVEQQAFYSATDGRISWMRVMCSGFRPAPPG